MQYLPLLFAICMAFAFPAQAQNAQAGGFDQNWANYNPAEFQPKTVTFDYSGIRSIVEAPAVGIHPRIYFGPSELADVVARLENTTSGQAVFKTVHAYTTLLNKGYSTATPYQHNSTYGQDAMGNRYVGNAGKWDSYAIYQDLINGVPTALDAADNKRRYLLASVMALEALECLVKAGQTDPDTGLTYNDRAANLATAMTSWANLVLGTADNNPENYNHFGGVHMAYCYDLNYNNMTTAQRDAVRAALAEIVRATPRYGVETDPYATTSNWVGLNTFEFLTNLAIEGETGYNTTLNEEYMRAYRNFLTYGWYESGAPYEGMGKNYQFVSSLIPMAKRGYSLLGHPNVRSYGSDFLPKIIQPYGYSFTSSDVWGGTGWDVEQGLYKFNAADIVGLKWAFPSNPNIDFVWRNYIEKGRNLNGSGYLYQQIEPATSGYHNYLLVAAIFPQDYTAGNWTAQNQAAQGGLSFLAPERGLGIMKSGYTTDDMMVYYHCRQDLGGHTHGDRNSFMLSALGRLFFRYTFGSAFQETEFHTAPLIDDIGIKITDRDGRKARQPGTLLGFSDDGTMAQIAGDATYAYSWEWEWQARPPGQNHSQLGTNNWEMVTETWNDFRYQPGTENYHTIPFYNFAHWNSAGNLERMVKRPYNTMERVYRTLAMVRCDYPYVLVADDLEKDDDPHNYKWVGQIASDLTLNTSLTDVNLVDSDYRCDVVLEDGSGRKFLVRVLSNEGYVNGTPPAYVDNSPTGYNGNDPATRLIVEADGVVAPNFQLLLFPYQTGDPIPHTAWNAAHDQLTVTIDDEQKTFSFIETDGKTDIQLVTVLPSEWLNVTAKALTKSIQINWSTANEINVQSFEIQRSTDGRAFEKIGESIAQNTTLNHYQLEDINAQAGVPYYYRIQQTDQDGTLSMSKVVSATINDKAMLFAIAPQPFKEEFTIITEQNIGANTFLKILDASGKVVHQAALSALATTISTTNWVNGTYYLQVEQDGQVLFASPLVKQ